MVTLNDTYAQAAERAAQDWARKMSGRVMGKVPLGTAGDPLPGGVDFPEVRYAPGANEPAMQPRPESLPEYGDLLRRFPPAPGIRFNRPAAAGGGAPAGTVPGVPGVGLDLTLPRYLEKPPPHTPGNFDLSALENTPASAAAPATVPAAAGLDVASPTAAPAPSPRYTAGGLPGQTQAFVDLATKTAAKTNNVTPVNNLPKGWRWESYGEGGLRATNGVHHVTAMPGEVGDGADARMLQFYILGKMGKRDDKTGQYPGAVPLTDDPLRRLAGVTPPEMIGDRTRAQVEGQALRQNAPTYTGPMRAGGVARAERTNDLDVATMQRGAGLRFGIEDQRAAAQRRLDERAERAADLADAQSDLRNQSAGLEYFAPGSAGGRAAGRVTARGDQLDREEKGRGLAVKQMESNERVAKYGADAAAAVKEASIESRGKKEPEFKYVAEKQPGKDGGEIIRVFRDGQEVLPADKTTPQDAWDYYTNALQTQKRGWFNDYVLHAFGDHYGSDADKLLDGYWSKATGRPAEQAPHRTGKIGAKDVAAVAPKFENTDNNGPARTAQSGTPAAASAAGVVKRVAIEYKPGTVRNGFRFKGGDPREAKNWEKV